MRQILRTDHPSLGSDRAASANAKMLAVTFVAAFGLFLIFGAGFVQPDALHNAAHDTRHALAFPCH